MRASTIVSVLVVPPCIVAIAPDVSTALQQILNQAHQGPLYTYPTSLTQDIVPKLIHSHNDYWRDVPFYSAISVGAVSVEADVWLYNGTLHIGHEQGALTNARTFESLYIDPILDTLQRQNPTNSSFLTAPTHNGVFDTNGAQTLYLFVDVKTPGNTTWPYVVRALEPLCGTRPSLFLRYQVSMLIELQTTWRLALHRQLLQPIHPRSRHRDWHRQYSSRSSPARHTPLLLLRCPHSHPQQHLLQHYFSSLSHRIYRLRGQFWACARHIAQRYTTGAAESSGSNGTCKRDNAEILGSAWLAY